LSRPVVIAIVDDDLAVREALCELLEVEGMAALGFERAVAFLDRAGEFDCVISDVRMPGMDGLELQRRLRACGSAIPMIFVTSLADETACARALRDGATAWFAKPVMNATLLGALRVALGSTGRDA